MEKSRTRSLGKLEMTNPFVIRLLSAQCSIYEGGLIVYYLNMQEPHTKEERALKKKGYKFIAGIDEAGRGPLAGPVVAAAVIIPFHHKIKGVRDCKQMTAKAREKAYKEILKKCIDYGVGVIDHEIIETVGIYKATKMAMEEAVRNFKKTSPEFLLIDAMELETEIEQKAIIKGDVTCYSIAAASVIAKVVRDNIMKEYHEMYPEYDFHLHKGYSTKLHREKLKKHGPSPIHRKSYKPIADLLIK